MMPENEITERKKVQKELRASERRFRKVVEKNADAMLIADCEGIVTVQSSPLWKTIVTFVQVDCPSVEYESLTSATPPASVTVAVMVTVSRSSGELGAGEVSIDDGKRSVILTRITARPFSPLATYA